jgi:flagellar basal-body rod protein FlgB
MITTGLNLNDMLEVKMSYDAERQKVLAQNIASIDTPGYQAEDLVPLDFQNVLAAQNRRVNMARTSVMDMDGTLAYTQRFRDTADTHPYEITPTGGTVVVEEQMMKVAQNATDYQMITNLYKKVGNLFKEALGLSPSA